MFPAILLESIVVVSISTAFVQFVVLEFVYSVQLSEQKRPSSGTLTRFGAEDVNQTLHYIHEGKIVTIAIKNMS